MAWVGPYNLIVSNGVLQNSSDVFNILDPDTGGASTFSVRLSASGLVPVTHWGCRTVLQDTTHSALTTLSNPQFMTFVNNLAAQLGRTPVGSVTAFKSSLQISTNDFWTFIATLGLKAVE